MTDFIANTIQGLKSERAIKIAEVKRLDEAIRALEPLTEETPVPDIRVIHSKPVPRVRNRKRGGGKITNVEKVTTVLSEQPNGASFKKICDLIYERYGESIKKTSLSPLLTKLRSRGVAELIDDTWYAKKYVPEKAEGLL